MTNLQRRVWMLKQGRLTRFATPRRPQSAMDVLGGVPAFREATVGSVPTARGRQQVERRLASAPATLGFSGIQSRGDNPKLGPMEHRAMIADAFRRHSVALPEGFLSDSTRATPSIKVAEAIQNWQDHYHSVGRGGAHVLAGLHPDSPEHAAVRLGLMLTNGMDEGRHQLEKGHEVSGGGWYTHDIHDLDKGLIVYHAPGRGRDGSYTSEFGRVDAGGRVTHRTPALHLFKTMMAPLSGGVTPGINLKTALDLYRTAKYQAMKHGGSPFLHLPEHRSIPVTGTDPDAPVRGQYDPELGAQPYLSYKNYLGLTPRQRARRVAHLALGTQSEGMVKGMQTVKRVMRHFNGDEAAAANWFLTEHPFSSADPRNPGLLEMSGKDRGGLMTSLREDPTIDPVGGSHLGTLVFGPKYGRFAANLIGSSPGHEHLLQQVTKDMWWTRSWGRVLGGLVGDVPPSAGAVKQWLGRAARAKRDGLPIPPRPEPQYEIKQTPEAHERPLMDHMANLLSSHLGLTPSEFQAAWWYFEQGLWRAFGAKANSESFGPEMKKLFKHGAPLAANGEGYGLPPHPSGQELDQLLGATPYEQRLIDAHLGANGMPRVRSAVRFERSHADQMQSVFGGLRAQAAQLIAQGRMPDLVKFLHVVGNALALHKKGRLMDQREGREPVLSDDDLFRQHHQRQLAQLPPPVQMAMQDGPHLYARPMPGRPGPLGTALAVARSRQSLAIAHAVRVSLDRLGAKPNQVHRAVLNTGGGSLPAAVAAVHNAVADPQTLAAAGWLGMMGQVPGAVAFRSLPGGPDKLHRISFNGPVGDLTGRLQAAGAYTHTLIPTKTGTTALVYDQGGRLTRNLMMSGLDVATADGVGAKLGGRQELRSGTRAADQLGGQ